MKLMVLDEDIAAVKKYYPNIDDDVFMQLISLDPTYRDGSNSVGKYGKWILNLFKKGAISKEDFSEITPLLKQFTTYKNRVQNKDLNTYKTLDDLSNTLAQVVDDDSMLSDRQKLRFRKNVKAGRISTDAEDDYDVVFEDADFIVYVPNTHEASMKLGNGTKWCTAHENPDWYDKYTDDGGKLYIFKDKKSGKRWQYSDLRGDFLDDDDKSFDVNDLLSADNSLKQFISKMVGIELSDDTFIYTGGYLDNIKKSLIKNVTILDGTDYVSPGVFAECTDLISVKMQNKKHIYDSAFQMCRKLESVILPDGLKTIGSSAFFGCTNLKYVKIPNSVTKIGSNAFLGCGLTSVELPDGLEVIDYDTFSRCKKLKSIIIPSNVTAICQGAFYQCVELSRVIIHDGVKKIGSLAFGSCISLESVIIPRSVDRIDSSAFEDCSNLTHVKLLDGVKTIEESAFSNCTNLKSVEIPNSVIIIKDNSFTGCNNLIIYTDSDYVKEYCSANDIPCKPVSKSKTESLKLRIAEDTACVASKTSYIDEDGLDKNGIYYFGKKPKPPVNWKDYKKDDIKNFNLKERSDRKMKLSIKESFADENGMFMQMDDAMSGLIGNVDDSDIDEVVRYYSTVSGKLGKKDKFSDIVCYFCSDSADVCDPIDSSKIYFGFKSIYKDRKFDSYVSSKYGDKFVIDHFNDNFRFTVYATNEDVINRLIDDLSNEYDNL